VRVYCALCTYYACYLPDIGYNESCHSCVNNCVSLLDRAIYIVARFIAGFILIERFSLVRLDRMLTSHCCRTVKLLEQNGVSINSKPWNIGSTCRTTIAANIPISGLSDTTVALSFESNFRLKLALYKSDKNIDFSIFFEYSFTPRSID